MPTFAFSGRTRGGENINGERVADNADAAVAALRREQVLVTRIAPTKRRRRPRAAKKGKLGKKVDPKNLAVFMRQFSVMIDAGLPLVQCLEILGAQEEDKNFAETILATRSDVESGASLADAMKKHPRTFDPLFSNMIAAGEAGGILDTILKRLADLHRKSRQAEESGEVGDDLSHRGHRDRRSGRRRHSVEGHSDLRGPVLRTRRGAAAADAHRHRAQRLPRCASCRSSSSASWPLAMGSRRTTATAGGKHLIDGITLKLPVLGLIMRKIAVARFCRTLSTLLSSGVPILDGLDITARTSGNVVIEEAILLTRKSIERGETISAPLKETGVFPPMVTQMIAVGETTGALDTMLSKIADFYEDEVDTAVAGLLTLLEPIMIAFLGGVVGGIVIAMYLPIFDLISKLT